MRAFCIATGLLAAILLPGQSAEERNFTANISEFRDLQRALPNYMISATRRYVADRPRMATDLAGHPPAVGA